MLKGFNAVMVAASIIVTTLSPYAAADVSISYSGAQQTTVFHIGGNQLVVNVGDDQDGGIMYDLDTDKVYAIQHSEKQYIELEEMMQQAMGMKSQMQQMLKAQMQGMSEAEKTQMESMMGGMLSGLMGDKEESKKPTKTVFNFTGEKDIAGGYTCEKVDMTLGTGEQKQVCVAPANTLGISDADQAVLHGMMKKMGGLSDKMSQISGQYLFGFVGDFKEVLVKSYAKDQIQLIEVAPLSISVDSLGVPAGYTKAEISPF